MKRLIVAAGGGGDAVAAAMLHAALYGDDGEPALILTYSWDRLIIDPVPGPRSPADFTGLRQLTPHVWAVPGTATPKPPHASTLPRLAAELPHTFALIDPYAGATGIARQLSELITHFTPETIDLLDVGGDILAHGDEPTLRSPLADALILAACARTQAPVRLLVAGPGLDGELPTDVLRPRLGPLLTTLTHEHAQAILPVLTWHPSEATALLTATALGARGLCEIRDAGLPAPLTAEGPTVHEVDVATAFAANRLAQAIAATTTLDEAEEHCRTVCGTSEIDYERTKARGLPQHQRVPAVPHDLLTQIKAFEREAATRGTTYTTIRRLAEALGLANETLPHLIRLNAARPGNLPASVWKLHRS
ncbi:DUF1152 domain-containing protein [Streptomyces sp. NPDC058471]|uniref:DUF1152 domain-containing protein n=1 Tax=Streptomyces sp. NPDC058471 TaxID=3346516 RepID=UPI003664F726